MADLQVQVAALQQQVAALQQQMAELQVLVKGQQRPAPVPEYVPPIPDRWRPPQGVPDARPHPSPLMRGGPAADPFAQLPFRQPPSFGPQPPFGRQPSMFG